MIHYWMPHGGCVQWDPAVLTVSILANLAIGVCYVMIPLAIMGAVKPVNDKWSRLFAAFILLCGMTHFFQILTVWRPWYWLEAGLSATTAIVSVMTVINLYLYKAELLARVKGNGGQDDNPGT